MAAITPLDNLIAKISEYQKLAGVCPKNAKNAVIFLQSFARNIENNLPTIAGNDPTSLFVSGDYLTLNWAELSVSAVFKDRDGVSICHIVTPGGGHILPLLDGVWAERVARTFLTLTGLKKDSYSDDEEVKER